MLWTVSIMVAFVLVADPLPENQKGRPPIEVTDLESATITISPKGSCRFGVVKTPGGHRVRFTSEGLTLEASKFRMSVNGWVHTYTIDDKGMMNVSSERLP